MLNKIDLEGNVFIILMSGPKKEHNTVKNVYLIETSLQILKITSRKEEEEKKRKQKVYFINIDRDVDYELTMLTIELVSVGFS
jgi:hypothetical protein